MNFLQDKVFLSKLNHFKIKEYLASIVILDFETENPIAKLEGLVVSGSLNVAGNAATRRTGSFTLRFDNSIYNITSVNNLIAIDKKISFSIGLKNQLFNDPAYQDYGEELWFKMGIYYITGASINVSTSSIQVTVNIIDKSAGLNGTCGGTLPASVSFHEQVVINEKGEEEIQYPTINRIIYEMVQHFGKEHPSRILVEDVPEVGRWLAVYQGDTPIQFENVDSSSSDIIHGRNYKIATPPQEGYDTVFHSGEIVGYIETDLSYPGDLIGNVGSNINTVLDNIVKTLGNYEYFYDIEGNFHFRKIRNFQATDHTPLNPTPEQDYDLQYAYIPKFTEYQYLNELADSTLITQASMTPKFDNIKNDFVCWGSKQNTSGTSTITNKMVRYHLAIDERPEDHPEALCRQNIYVIKNIEDGKIIRYQINTIVNSGERAEVFCYSLKSLFSKLDSSYHFNWREELYRQALLNYGTSTSGYYDEELLAEWRGVFDPMNEDYKTDWENHFVTDLQPWYGYRVEVWTAPEKIRYWLDIISSNAPIGKYSVNRIGRRTIAKDDNQIDMVFSPEIPDIVLIENSGDIPANIEKAKYYVSIGQDYSFIIKDDMGSFKTRNSLGTCYDVVRDMLYTNLFYNATVSITCLPIFYLDVNNVIRVNLSEYGITGDFVINSLSFQIGQQASTMSIQLSEANIVI